jgi:thioredoxin reductase (NADPH)
MCQAAYQIINPGKKYVLKYTYSRSWWIDGKQPKAVVKAIV